MALMLTVCTLPNAHAVTGNGAGADYANPSTGIWQDGCSYAKTGFLLYVTDSIGNVRNDYPPVFVTSYSWETPSLSWDDKVYFDSYFGNVQYDPRGSHNGVNYYSDWYAGIEWMMSPFQGNGQGNGTAIKNWLVSPQNGAPAGVLYIIDTYWGTEAMNKFLESATTGNTYQFHAQTVFWHGGYMGNQYQDNTWIGTVQGMAYYANSGAILATDWGYGSGYPFKRYDFAIAPLSMYLEHEWLPGTRLPSNLNPSANGYIDFTSLIQEAYGIVSVRPSDIGAGKQIIQSFYDETGNLIETTFENSGSEVDMQEEGFTVTNWIVTEEVLEEPDSDDEYSSIISGVPTTRTGIEDETIELTEEESTVVIKYTQDNTPYRIVKVSEKKGTHKKTVTTGYSNTSYTVQTSSTYQGDSYGCKSWFTSKNKPIQSPSPTKTWSSILSSYKEAYSFIV